MAKTNHLTLVDDQFGPQAAAYVASAVHAAGEDLAALHALAAGRQPARALDLGCGGGHAAFAMAPSSGLVVAYDLSAKMLAAVEAEAGRRGITNLSTERGTAERLPFSDETFDFVASRFSAHHWNDLDAGLAEARRVTRRGGMAVFMDVCSPGTPLLDTFLQTIELMRDPSHVRNYSRDEWVAAVTRAGFAAGRLTRRRLRLEFAPWIARIRTPAVHAEAIRSLQDMAPDEARHHFEFEDDGSFTLDTMTLEATVP
ncbi:Methyltransferase domain-containing protein [Pseudoxanthobacter soli DSM 19599]|uniref:Methyltransferase domain-containing protein n=1 Tax=Pseudoxanthobacter soli DSM 19599 TaxID=1123029 RepID=A0A1M7Z6I6_9HYPH|nr:class I SAM-dependent methyltransferase [Pseudoxanthobacter soli]SHO60558.1 Methyltransferase domain-containing protein [Pseudoxanthobacter soli DSM 19599]